MTWLTVVFLLYALGAVLHLVEDWQKRGLDAGFTCLGLLVAGPGVMAWTLSPRPEAYAAGAVSCAAGIFLYLKLKDWSHNFLRR